MEVCGAPRAQCLNVHGRLLAARPAPPQCYVAFSTPEMTSSAVAEHCCSESAQLIPSSPSTTALSSSHLRRRILHGTSRGEKAFNSSVEDRYLMQRSLLDQNGRTLSPPCAENEATFLSLCIVQTDPALATSAQNICSTSSAVSVIALMQHNVLAQGRGAGLPA